MSARKKDTTGKTAGKVDPLALAFLTYQVRNHLAFHQEMGLDIYPAVPKLQQFLARVPRQQPVQSAHLLSKQGREHQRDQGNHLKHSSPHKMPQQGRWQPVAPPAVSSTHHIDPQVSSKISLQTLQQQLEALNQEITQCRCCSSSALKKILGQGSPRPRLCVLGDYFLKNPSEASGNLEENLLWGREEDAMLWRMMQAIGLERKSVYVTNAIKCSQPAFVQPGSPQEQFCCSHLEKELQIIRPALICAMGDTAARVLLKTKAPLVRLRGRFHTYRYPQGGTAKIMPTYHPRLLVQYPDMKQATWKDLQAVQRLL